MRCGAVIEIADAPPDGVRPFFLLRLSEPKFTFLLFRFFFVQCPPRRDLIFI